jgi:hypothetical protein
MLERRMMSDRRILLEEDKKDGDINASPREQSYIDGTKGTMRDAPFTVYSNGMEGRTQYFYQCVSNRDKPLEGQVPEEKTGTIVDQNGKIVTAAELGLIPGYQNKLSVACKPVYDDLAKWIKTFCANLKNKTKPNYAWNCPEAAKPVAAAAESPAAPIERGPTPPTPPTPEQIETFAKVDQKLKTDLTKFYEVGLLSLTKEDLSTPKTDQELEAEVKTWNDYLANSGIGLGLRGGESFPLSKEMRGYFQRNASAFIKKKPNLTQPIKISGQ